LLAVQGLSLLTRNFASSSQLDSLNLWIQGVNWQTYPIVVSVNIGSMVSLPFANFAHLVAANVVFAPNKTVFIDPLGGLCVYIGDWSNTRNAQWHIDNEVNVVARKVTPSISTRATATLPSGIEIDGGIGDVVKFPYDTFGSAEGNTFMPGGTLLFDDVGSVAVYIGDGETPRTPKWHVDSESDIVAQIMALASAGNTNHAELSNLDYANSGHTGFASQAGLEAESQARHQEITTAIETEAQARHEEITTAINEEATDRLQEDTRLNNELMETNRVLSGKVTQTLTGITLNKTINGETAIAKGSLASSIPLIGGGSWVNDADGTLAIYAGDLNPNTAIFRTKTIVGTSGGTTNHAAMSNLDYNNSGHTGFASSDDIDYLTHSLEGKADIWEVDVTATPAPPALSRTNGWRIGATGQVIGDDYNYLRYLYRTRADAVADDPYEAIAAWDIQGKRMRFSHILSGRPHYDIITDEDGNVLIEEVRPIPDGEVWWFGDIRPFDEQYEATPFPTDDTFFSILEIGVPSLMSMIGDTFQLQTENKDIVGAVNELFYVSPMVITVPFGEFTTLVTHLLGDYAWVKIVGYHEMAFQAYGMPYTPASQTFRMSEWTARLNTDPSRPQYGLYYSGGFDTYGAVTMADADAVFHDVEVHAVQPPSWGIGNELRPVLIYLYRAGGEL